MNNDLAKPQQLKFFRRSGQPWPCMGSAVGLREGAKQDREGTPKRVACNLLDLPLRKTMLGGFPKTAPGEGVVRSEVNQTVEGHGLYSQIPAGACGLLLLFSFLWLRHLPFLLVPPHPPHTPRLFILHLAPAMLVLAPSTLLSLASYFSVLILIKSILCLNLIL